MFVFFIEIKVIFGQTIPIEPSILAITCRARDDLATAAAARHNADAPAIKIKFSSLFQS